MRPGTKKALILITEEVVKLNGIGTKLIANKLLLRMQQKQLSVLN